MTRIEEFWARYKPVLWLAFAPLSLLIQLPKINSGDVSAILRPLRVILFALGVGVFAFILVPQGQHAMKSLSHFYTNFTQSLFVFIGLSYWSFQLYINSRLLITRAKIRHDEGKELRLYVYKNNLPIILSTAPFYILITGFITANGIHDQGDVAFIVSLLLLNLGLTFFYFNLTCTESFCSSYGNWRSPLLQQKVRSDLRSHSLSPNLQWWFSFLIVAFALVFLAFTYWTLDGIEVLQFMGPTAVVITGLAAWVSMAALSAAVHYRFNRFAIYFILGLLFYSSFYNNNHAISVSENPIVASTDVASYYREWQKKRVHKGKKPKPYPVFVVSIEGGGSRSAYWSGSMLGALCDTLPELANHLFAISAVSGGSLGSGMFTLLRRIEVIENRVLPKLHYSQNALKKDFLSPLTASMIFPDFMQRFIPFKAPLFDRARTLERSWDNAFGRSMKDKSLAHSLKISMNDLWRGDSLFQIPALFLNCTVINTGKRAVFSNLNLWPDYFDDVVDLRDTIGKAISLSTAISLSSRFPYITPSGLIQKKNGKNWGLVADGGYFDNSGILTALEILEIIKKVNLESKTGKIFEPHLLIISNYSGFSNNTHYTELNEPILATLNRTIGGSIGYARARVKKEIPPEQIIELSLKATSAEAPLGWYLSTTAVDYMNERVHTVLSKNYPYFYDLLKKSGEK
jgi:hypothetical protein